MKLSECKVSKGYVNFICPSLVKLLLAQYLELILDFNKVSFNDKKKDLVLTLFNYSLLDFECVAWDNYRVLDTVKGHFAAAFFFFKKPLSSHTPATQLTHGSYPS